MRKTKALIQRLCEPELNLNLLFMHHTLSIVINKRYIKKLLSSIDIPKIVYFVKHFVKQGHM